MPEDQSYSDAIKSLTEAVRTITKLTNQMNQNTIKANKRIQDLTELLEGMQDEEERYARAGDDSDD